ncbi:hypothetical protein tb265_38860 [Gemmatimonadetes bacterium T265]|nr:hypothetical protein tb265_38860 [Gemmatimonadetes bacterium T265]
MRACRKAWRADVPCTLADTPAAWERLLGAAWKRAVAALRVDFTPDPDQPGRVVCLWLRALWEQQAGIYQRRSTTGAKGGKARSKAGATDEQSASNASSHAASNGEALLQPGQSKAAPEIRKKRDYVPTSLQDVGDVRPPAADAAVAGAPPGGALAPSAAADERGAGAPNGDGPPDPDALRRALAAEPALAELLGSRAAPPGGERREGGGLAPAFGAPLDDRPRRRTREEAKALLAAYPDPAPATEVER